MDETRAELQKLSSDLEKSQEDTRSNVEALQKLESQGQENKAVQKELARSEQNESVYKLVGPVLLKQDRQEAAMAVHGRLAFIEKERNRIERQIEGFQASAQRLRTEIINLQSTT